MPEIIFPSGGSTNDGSVGSKAWAFLQKLRQSDKTGGMRLKPVKGAVDRRIRTARVDDNYRAVLVEVTGSDRESRYVFLGIFKHDVAYEYAENVEFRRNVRTGGAEIVRVDVPAAILLDGHESADTAAVDEATGETEPRRSLLQLVGVTFDDLVDVGIAAKTAYEAINASDQERLLEIACAAPSDFQGDALMMLASGSGVEEVRKTYGVTPVDDSTAAVTDDDLIAALDHPVSRMEFGYLTDDADLRAAIEDEDFGRWRVFLHPEQRAYVEAETTGPVRLSGGAGTGKTVVLLHRARHLHQRSPDARILLTTYTKTLADALKAQLLQLDRSIVLAKNPGDPGVYVSTLDSVARRLIVRAGEVGLDIGRAAVDVLGRVRGEIVPSTERGLWDAVLPGRAGSLPDELRTESFLDAEYAAVVVPQRITTRDEYLRVRRPGRGVALGRSQRSDVWDVIEAYREMTAAVGTTTFDEKAMIVATALDTAAANGASRVADHVLVDEAQDLGPSHLRLLRALVAAEPDDLLLAEDSRQRIYAPQTVLSRYGIYVTGRSRRLQLNYRTTSQNLGYATAVLAGRETVDLEGNVVDDSGLRSLRSGPAPTTIGCDTQDEAFRAVAKEVKGWLSDGVLHGTIGVLVHSANEAMALMRYLNDQAVPAQFVGRNDAPGADRVVVMTMHRSKGMEFRHVVVFGVTAAATSLVGRTVVGDQDEAALRERSLLYVATTRARERVVVVWHGQPSELLPTPQPSRVTAVDVAVIRREKARVDVLTRDVHDGTGHAFALIAMLASRLEAEVDPEHREGVAQIRVIARRGHDDLRKLLDALRSGADGRAAISFDDLSKLLDGFREQDARITTDVDVVDGHTAELPLMRACYGIVQESVTNALSHAQGKPIDIVLRGAPGSHVVIIVQNPLLPGDTGRAGEERKHSGIEGMTARAEELGGTLTVGPVNGVFVVDARIPWQLV